jgi:protein phosphatase 1H
MGAQELVQAARGRLIDRVWRLKSDVQDSEEEEILPMASVDDISVMVVPLYPYLCEHRQWIKTRQQEKRHSINSLQLLTNDST